MEIESPLHITVQDDESSMKRELHITFNQGFRNEKLFERREAFQRYIDSLKNNLAKLEKDNVDFLGMEAILQICEQLAEYIDKDEVDLDEKIIIEISPSVDVSNFITGATSIK